MAAIKLYLILLGGCLVSGEVDWTSQCNRCKCVWANGKKSADCKGLQFNDIPRNLSPELREIDFSNNTLYELKPNVFGDVGLGNVHKLKLQNCSIHNIFPTAFRGLELLIELDLSDNAITTLNRFVFQDNIKLRILDLRRNKIKVLENGLFSNHSHLQKVDVSDNLLDNITADIFRVTPGLRHINLSNNKIKHMNYDFTKNFSKLSSLALDGNPWVCDCYLQEFRNASIHKNLITAATCSEPERLRDMSWKEESVVFACKPHIIEPIENRRLEITSANFTISCAVNGNPKPDVDWIYNGRIIDRDPRLSVQKYVTQEETRATHYFYNLTIVNVNYRDKGDYKCVAKNPGGEDERNFTLVVMGLDHTGVGVGSSALSAHMALIIGLIVGAIILLIIIIVLIFCCCKRNGRDNHIGKNRSINQSSELYCMDGRPEMEKALITDVNPIVKPPRQYSVPASVTSGGTEVSEAKKMLIDDESFGNMVIYLCFSSNTFLFLFFPVGDDETRSFDYESRIPMKSQNHLDDDFRSDHPYPPDLLSFPPRGMSQVSPAGSSASTVADTSRLPVHHGPQSPLHSPLYETSSIYRTLPYSRSQSPFTSPLGPPVRVPRQGYVTIPRRPRQSWSSEPPSTSDLGEPLYDNLGLRTTASGNSVLSLNKLGEATTPRTPRTQYPSMIPDPIAEHESPPTAATLPRSASAQRALSPNLETIRNNWARTPEQTDSRRDSTASLIPSDGKTPKIPPRPPPKPKKRTSTGPLFEDEGEDGTEV